MTIDSVSNTISFATNSVTISLGAGSVTLTAIAGAAAGSPQAEVGTTGSDQITTFFGAVDDFDAGAPIDQNNELYSFAAYSSPSEIPNSAADDFIGVSFSSGSGGTQYGYVEIDGTNLVGYGFQTAPNTTILTGAQQAACFAEGTRLLAGSGEEIPVDTLCVGDELLTAGGGVAAVKWIGHRRVECSRHPRPRDVWPVRIKAGAFGSDRPKRDLLLSPDHAVFVDGNLIPIRRLINGGGIAQEQREEITYWHVELARHDIVVADGLEAESYLDTGNRGAFVEYDVLDFYPTFERSADRAWADAGCAPLVESGPILEAARAQLAVRSDLIGLPCPVEATLGVTGAGLVSLEIAPDVSLLRIVSSSATPDGERRRLGVAITFIALDEMPVGLDDERLLRGFHAIEGEAGATWRWTDGEGVIALPVNGRTRLFEAHIVALATAAAELERRDQAA